MSREWLTAFTAEEARLLSDLEALVRIESPSHDAAAVSRLAAFVEEKLRAAGVKAERRACPPAGDALVASIGAGEGGTLLYVGKSRNLRSRVLDHFSAGHRSGKEAKLGSQVREVEWIETGGELGALLLESRMVKELAPTANRRLRKSACVFCVRLHESDGALQPCVEALDAEFLDGDEEAYGPFRSERDAWRALEGKARQAGLCLKLTGLEQGPGSCFGFQLGRCRGACGDVDRVLGNF